MIAGIAPVCTLGACVVRLTCASFYAFMQACLLRAPQTCGVCKPALQRFEAMCRDAAAARARVVFLKVDVCNEYDNTSGA
jgi:hypothetical protein